MLDNELSKSILSRFSNENLWEFMRVDCRRGQVTQQKQFRIWEICTWLLFSHSVMSDLCDLMNCSTLDFPRLHHIQDLAQTQVHWVSGAIHPSLPLSFPSPPTFNLSQHQSLFQWVGSSHQEAKGSASASVLPMNIQGRFPLELTGLILQSKGLQKGLLQHNSKPSNTTNLRSTPILPGHQEGQLQPALLVSSRNAQSPVSPHPPSWAPALSSASFLGRITVAWHW